MELFTLESVKTKVKNRIPDLQSLSEKLNANFYDANNQVSVKDMIEKFNFHTKDSDIENCYVISGEIQGYEYCFIEYYHKGHGKSDQSRWISKVSLLLNNDYPDFNIMTKKQAYTSMGCLLTFGGIFLSVPFFFIIHFLRLILSVYSKGDLTLLIPLAGPFLFTLIFGAVGCLICFASLKNFRTIRSQGKYNIQNLKFREKYVIYSDSDVNSIRKVFNENVVSKIVNFKPEITNLTCNKNCLQSDFSYEELLSYESCNKYLGPLLKQAQIIEETDV